MNSPIPITEPEHIWLQEAYRRFRARKPIDVTSMRLTLRDKLPSNFSSSKIRAGLLLHDGYPSLVGILAIDPDSGYLRDTELVIRAIRDLLIDQPDTKTITAADIAGELDFREEYTQMLFGLMSSAGSFWSSAQGTPSQSGYSSITVDREDNIQEFLGFDNLEAQLRRRFEEYQRLQADSTTPASRPHQDVIPNTAFIIMQMGRAEYDEVRDVIKKVCLGFGIEAVRADDIEHQKKITDVVLERIRTAQFLIADLTGERPNVYYEVGYAHALGKEPIMYRRSRTRLHFDLSDYNVPAYKDIANLEAKLTRRLRALLNKD